MADETDEDAFLLSEVTDRGARIWCNKKGWHWVDKSVPWIMCRDSHVHGPFASARAAGRDCAQKLGIRMAAG